MPRVNKKIKGVRLHKSAIATATPRRIENSAGSIDLCTMTSSELLDAFSAVQAIDKGVAYVPTASGKVIKLTKKYRGSAPIIRKEMRRTICRAIVEKNARENPVTPEMTEKIKKIFG